eukprot:7028948-Prymnesium_polylepis.1
MSASFVTATFARTADAALTPSVRTAELPDRGVGTVATRLIRKGEQILFEATPLLRVSLIEQLLTAQKQLDEFLSIGCTFECAAGS